MNLIEYVDLSAIKKVDLKACLLHFFKIFIKQPNNRHQQGNKNL